MDYQGSPAVTTGSYQGGSHARDIQADYATDSHLQQAQPAHGQSSYLPTAQTLSQPSIRSAAQTTHLPQIVPGGNYSVGLKGDSHYAMAVDLLSQLDEESRHFRSQPQDRFSIIQAGSPIDIRKPGIDRDYLTWSLTEFLAAAKIPQVLTNHKKKDIQAQRAQLPEVKIQQHENGNLIFSLVQSSARGKTNTENDVDYTAQLHYQVERDAQNRGKAGEYARLSFNNGAAPAANTKPDRHIGVWVYDENGSAIPRSPEGVTRALQVFQSNAPLCQMLQGIAEKSYGIKRVDAYNQAGPTMYAPPQQPMYPPQGSTIQPDDHRHEQPLDQQRQLQLEAQRQEQFHHQEQMRHQQQQQREQEAVLSRQGAHRNGYASSEQQISEDDDQPTHSRDFALSTPPQAFTRDQPPQGSLDTYHVTLQQHSATPSAAFSPRAARRSDTTAHPASESTA